MVRKGFVMRVRRCSCLSVVITAFGLFLQVSTDQALAQDRRQECSARYKAAKAEGSLGGLTWPQFFSRCVAELKAAAPAEAQPAAAPEPVNPLKPAPEEPVRPAAVEPTPAAPSAAEAPAPVKQPAPPAEALTAAPPVPEPAKPPKPEPVAPAVTAVPPAPAAAPSVKEAAPTPREPVFPAAIGSAYSKLKPGAARQKTCLDQYNANKATDSNGGLKWTQKGGGYLSKCLEHLGAS